MSYLQRPQNFLSPSHNIHPGVSDILIERTIRSRSVMLKSLAFKPASRKASSDAATANCENRPIFRWSSRLRSSNQELSGMIPATVLGRAAYSSRWAVVEGWSSRETIPDSPAIRRLHDCFTDVPRGDRRPRPVTTTLRAVMAPRTGNNRRSLFEDRQFFNFSLRAQVVAWETSRSK
jgi:hypothetical protein